MADFAEIQKAVASMSTICLGMWQQMYRAFMEHDAQLIEGILKDEQRLNDLEKELTASLIALNRDASDPALKEKALFYADIVGDIELIGDYCKDMLERIQIKIEEKLLFSDDAVKEYAELYRTTEKALDEINCALTRNAPLLVKNLTRKDSHIDTLVDELRKRHNQRLVDGVCSPMACNMYLNMLDFTAAVYYHAKKIARSMVKIER